MSRSRENPRYDQKSTAPSRQKRARPDPSPRKHGGGGGGGQNQYGGGQPYGDGGQYGKSSGGQYGGGGGAGGKYSGAAQNPYQGYGGPPQDTYVDPNAAVPILMKNKTGTRLFLGSVSSECTKETFISLIEEILGKKDAIADVFVNAEKGFAFIDMDTRENATAVKAHLDGRPVYNRNLVVRRANHKSSIWVGDIPDSVSNEILYKAFERFFGPVDRAIVSCDGHGKPLGWGFVEFTQKRSSKEAVERCGKEFFLLTKDGRPVKVEPFVPYDDEDGLPEHKTQRTDKQSEQVSVAPDFCKKEIDAANYAYCIKWRELNQKHAKMKAELKEQIARETMELSREQKKGLQEAELKKRKEEREQQAKVWQDLHEARMKAAKAARELQRIESSAISGYSMMGRPPMGGPPMGGPPMGGPPMGGPPMGGPPMGGPGYFGGGPPGNYGQQPGYQGGGGGNGGGRQQQQMRQNFQQHNMYDSNKRQRYDQSAQGFQQPYQQQQQQWGPR